MKTWLIIAVSAAVGVGIGFGTAYYDTHTPPWDGTPAGVNEVANVPVLPPPPTGMRDVSEMMPLVHVDNETFMFGSMDAQSKKSHDFIFTNKGKRPLELKKGDTTCRCTKFEIEKTMVEPGESTKVTMEWSPKGYRGVFQQTATIFTSDPSKSKITLRVEGRVTNVVKVDPSDLSLNSVPATEPTQKTVKIFAFLPGELKITSHELSEPATAKFFDIKYEPMPKEDWSAEQDAQGGVLVHITIKPGLPIGAFRQTIHMKTNYGEKVEGELPIHGMVVSELSVLGGGYDPEKGILSLGTIDSQEGHEHTLFLIARGKLRKDVKIERVDSTPDFIQLEAGKPVESGDLQVVRIPLTIRIPKGSPPSNYFGPEVAKLARLTLKTNHPQAPEIRIYLRFVVRG